MNMIRMKPAVSAKAQLKSSDKKAASIALRLLNSALDAAKNKQLKEETLTISEAVCNEGRKLKRYFIRARGRTTPFLKRSSHLKIGLDQIKAEKTKTKESKVKRDGSQS